MITKIGHVIELVTTAVKQLDINQHSDVVVRVGDDGEEMLIESVKVRGGLSGPYLVLQVAKRQ